MGEASHAPYGRATEREPAVKEVHILWPPHGLGCDGATIATTAATQVNRGPTGAGEHASRGNP